MKYRHEMKYLMNDRDYVLIKLRLKTLMRTDVNAADSDGAYSVRSLYFDDYYNHAYNDKLAGDRTGQSIEFGSIIIQTRL